MTTRDAPQCLTCVHYEAPPGEHAVCIVFPAGVPWPIWDNTADHRQPYEGDNGQRWAAAWPGARFPERALTADTTP